MSSTDQPNSNRSGLDEDLVAYLDGELDVETARELEDLLATDLEAREKLARLEQAWDLLNELPQSEVDEAFTQSTIEMVAISVAEEIQKRQEELPRERRRRLLVGALSLTASLVLGFATVWLFWPDTNRQLLEDLSLLEQLDQYRQIEDIDYLHALRQQDLWSDENASARTEPLSMTERQLLVEQLPAEEKEALRRKQQRFAELPPAEQGRLRTLHESIQHDPAAAELRLVLANYYDWLLRIPQPQRATLASLDTEERLERVAKLRTDEIRDHQRQLAYRSDLDAVATWLADLVHARLREEEPSGWDDKLDSLSPIEQRGVLLWLAQHRGAPYIFQTVPDNIEPLIEHLSPANRARFEQEDNEGKKRLLLSLREAGLVWPAMREAVRKSIDSLMADVDQEDLVQFFQTLSQDDKDGLLQYSAELRDLRLRMMYFRAHKTDLLPEFAKEMKLESGWSGRWPPRGGMRDGTPSGTPGQRSSSPGSPPFRREQSSGR
jgi:hypothetical protein